MTTSESYTLPVGKNDQVRLQALNNICNPYTLEFIKKSGINLIGKTIVDVGCGTGIMATEWARLVGGHGKVIAIDMSEEQLALAKEYSKAQGIHNIEFICQSVYELKNLDIQADLVYSRFLLEHVPDVVLALTQMRAILKEGGYLFCENALSNETLFSDPESEVFLKWKKIRLASIKFSIVKNLYSCFKAAGLEPVQYETCQPLIAKGNNRRVLTLGYYGEKTPQMLEEKDVCTKAEFTHLLNEVEDFLQSANLVSLWQYIQILGKK